jgi:hypothetical protein
MFGFEKHGRGLTDGAEGTMRRYHRGHVNVTGEENGEKITRGYSSASKVWSNGRTLALPPSGRSTHLYVVGGSGVGKSKLLEYLVRQDIKAWREHHCGLLLLDPHGSVYQNVLDWLASGRAALKRPIVLMDMTRDDTLVAYNVLRQRAQAPLIPLAHADLDELIAGALHDERTDPNDEADVTRRPGPCSAEQRPTAGSIAPPKV